MAETNQSQVEKTKPCTWRCV